MRRKKATINATITGLTFLLTFIPTFIVRRVFLNNLGNELLGLSSLYMNIIGYLSIVEMGVGTAIIFSLYKPFVNKNFKEIKGYLEFYKNFYKTVGIFVLIVGILLIPFLGVFINSNINMFEARLYFILFILNTTISYFFSYKLCILTVAQEGYKISIGTAISKFFISVLQIIFLNIYNSFYIYLIIQIIINLIYYTFMNKYIDRNFKYIFQEKGEIKLEEKNNLIKNVKALFLHKIGSVLVFGTDNIVISSFINLNTVAKFNSYNMIINSLQGLLGTTMSAITPSIGNLLVEDNINLSYNIFKKIFFVNFWIASLVVIALFNTITQFVRLWLGDTQVIDNVTLSILLINVYFQFMRTPIDQFKEAAGLYHTDRFAPIFEGIINLIFSIFLARTIGLSGVLIGTFISNIAVIFWIKPMIVYKNVFKKTVIKYFCMYFFYLSIGLIPLVITNFITKNLKSINNIYALLINCIINIVIVNFIYILIFKNLDEFKYFANIIRGIFFKFKSKC
ncbi:lipopolysaccharide biosynthesis protein [Clostridium perfringens]